MNKKLRDLLKTYADKLAFEGMKYMADKTNDIEYGLAKQTIVDELYMKIESLEPVHESQVI